MQFEKIRKIVGLCGPVLKIRRVYQNIYLGVNMTRGKLKQKEYMSKRKLRVQYCCFQDEH